MKIKITKMSDKQKKLAKKYPRVHTTSCGAVEEERPPLPKEGEELAKKIEDALVNWTLTALRQIGMPEKIKNLEVQVIQEVRAVLKELYND